MKDKFRLIVITIVFVLTGLLLGYFALQDSGYLASTCVVDGIEYKEGDRVLYYDGENECVCGKDGIVECKSSAESDVQEDVSAPEISSLRKDGLEFSFNYLRGLNESNGFVLSSPISFTNLSFDEGNLMVVLEQMQLCPRANEASEQVGFFENIDNTIYLHNMVRPSDEDSAISCLVQIKYVFDSLEELSLDDMQIAFVDDNGVVTKAAMCIYNQKVYADSDIFRNAEGEICTCEEGVITCEENLVD